MTINDQELRAWLRSPSQVNELLPAELELVSLLDSGEQGIVFQGSCGGYPAAVKVYFPGQLQKRVEREVHALETIRSDSIVRLLWYGSLSYGGYDLPVVATELVSGMPLDERLEHNRLVFDELATVAYDVADAVNAMWKYRIVHRDLKPSNILIREDGRACVIDLGLARHMDRSSLTAMGATWGTYGYFSPEQLRGVRQLTCKSDVYALGIVLVESALGHHPTQGDQLRLFAQRLDENLPQQVEDWRYSSLLKRMLRSRPTSRPKPQQILDELTDFAPL